MYVIVCGMTSTVLTTKHGYGQNELLSELVKVLGKLGEKKNCTHILCHKRIDSILKTV